MPNSKDKHLDDLLAIQKMSAQLSDEQFKRLVKLQPGLGDLVSGQLTRVLLSMAVPKLLNNLDKIGVAPGIRYYRQ